MTCPYETLHIEKGATDEEVRAAFKHLAKKLHPDLNGGDSSRFDGVKAAYDLLTDPKARKDYDDFGVTPWDEGSHLRKRAMTECTRLFGMIMEKVSPDELHTVDLIGVMTQYAREHRSEHESNVKRMERLVKGYKKALKVIEARMKRKQGMGRDIFAQSLKVNIEKIQGGMAQERMAAQLWQEVIDVLELHEFDFEQEDQSFTNAASGFIRFTTTA